jgi:hypothetical protein
MCVVNTFNWDPKTGHIRQNIDLFYFPVKTFYAVYEKLTSIKFALVIPKHRLIQSMYRVMCWKINTVLYRNPIWCRKFRSMLGSCKTFLQFQSHYEVRRKPRLTPVRKTGLNVGLNLASMWYSSRLGSEATAAISAGMVVNGGERRKMIAAL